LIAARNVILPYSREKATFRPVPLKTRITTSARLCSRSSRKYIRISPTYRPFFRVALALGYDFTSDTARDRSRRPQRNPKSAAKNNNAGKYHRDASIENEDEADVD